MSEPGRPGGRASHRPNILLIMSDQQRFDSLGCCGASWVETPNLDRLAAQGVLFDCCTVNNTICTPSRASIWTGKHLPGHGVYRLYDDLPRDQVLFTEPLRRAGYRTGLFGKLHVSGRLFEASHRHPHDGFDEYEWCLEASIHLDSPFNGYAAWLREHHPDFYRRLASQGRAVLHHPREAHFTTWAAERSIDFIRRHAGREPFFCCMSVFDPHNPYQDYPLEMERYVHSELIPDPVRDERADLPDGIVREREHSYLGACERFAPEDIRSMRLGYFASVAMLDREVGRVLEALESVGASENTLVIFVSDHGDMLGDHGLLVKGAFFYDPVVRVPLIMRWPRRLPAGRRTDALVQPHDLAATILDAGGVLDGDENAQAGVGIERGDAGGTSEGNGGAAQAARFHDGLSLIPLAEGSAARVRDHAVCTYRNSGISDSARPWEPPIHATMIRDRRYKLSVYHSDPQDRRELYDLEVDPRELANLWDDPGAAGARACLTEALLRWMFEQEMRWLASRGGQELPGREDRLDNMMKRGGN